MLFIGHALFHLAGKKSWATFVKYVLTAFPVFVADLKAFTTDSGVLILQAAVNGHTRCRGVFPNVLSPGSSQVLQACAPENCFMLHNIALAGK